MAVRWPLSDLTGKPARIGGAVSVHASKTLSHGLPPAGPALDVWPMPTKARLAYPCGRSAQRGHPGVDAVASPMRRGWPDGQYRLRPGRADHRSGLMVFPWEALPHHHAVKMTPLGPAGPLEFYPHLGWQAGERPRPRPYASDLAEPSTSLHPHRLRRLCLQAFMCCTIPSSWRSPSEHRSLIASIRRRRIARPASSVSTRPDPGPGPFYTRQDYPELLRRSASSPESGGAAQPTTSSATARPLSSRPSTSATGETHRQMFPAPSGPRFKQFLDLVEANALVISTSTLRHGQLRDPSRPRSDPRLVRQTAALAGPFHTHQRLLGK